MRKLLNLLAASVGGGLALGFCLRSAFKTREASLVSSVDRHTQQIAELHEHMTRSEGLTERVEKLENDSRSQEAAISELRECTIQAAKNTQRLLDGIERLVVSRQPTPLPTMDIHDIRPHSR